MNTEVEIKLNGTTHSISAGETIADLLVELRIPHSGTAVACNDTVVRKALYAETQLYAGDRVEIIRAVAGG
ncbi:MAG: sulfur carrier protein ThiS [bacterium]